MSNEPNEALDVLREVWSAQEQDSAALDEACGESKGCKRMSEVGFDGLAGPDGDLRAAWRSQLEREGKLNSEAGSVRDLVFRHAQSRLSSPAHRILLAECRARGPADSGFPGSRRMAGWTVRRPSAS
jgi:hypothetical protein